MLAIMKNSNSILPLNLHYLFLHYLCFFLLYINDIPYGLLSNPKLFAENTSIFSVVQDLLSSSTKPNEDLLKISQWTYHGKKSFSVSKHAQKLFSLKNTISNVTFS